MNRGPPFHTFPCQIACSFNTAPSKRRASFGDPSFGIDFMSISTVTIYDHPKRTSGLLETPDHPILRFEWLDSLRIQVTWKMISRNLTAVDARNTKNRFAG